MIKLFFLFFLSISLCFSQPANHDAVNRARWESMTIAKHRVHEVQVIVNRIEKNRVRYDKVAKDSKVPWHVISSIHSMESGGSFNHHLHEGSSLKYRTKYVPKGRPKTGNPPFTWEYSAIDALAYDKMEKKNWSEVGSALTACEGYNGFGVAIYHPESTSAYLWAGTSAEKAGKYVGDNKWSATARSKQIGIAAIWKEIEKKEKLFTIK